MAVVPWYRFGGTAVILGEPYESAPHAVVPAGPREIPVMIAQPPEPPVADPQFVLPPTPSASEPTLLTHTVIVQRGSKIEIQSFPAAR
jgi:hypothetical protein